MKDLYSMLGMSRQNISQKLSRVQRKAMVADTAVELATQIRKDHPVMGSRKMYWKSLYQLPIGRDRCEELLLSRGFRVQFPRNFKRTTYSIGKLYHPNLIEGLKVDGINQVWQSDITYFEVNGKFYYLVFIVDVYSRRIVGWSADHYLWAEANIRALHQAIDSRKEKLEGMIHHSDRGSQYIDKGYSDLLKSHGIKPSMCQYAWQNAYCERVNGIIKNEYLKNWNITDFNSLKKYLNRTVNSYNNERPHQNLPNRMAPGQFEAKLTSGFIDVKPTMKLYKLDVEC